MKENKKDLLKEGLHYIENNNFIYFSSWIANLGVVPLFLFAAFLLEPCLVLFLDLLFFVTRVFETIIKLLYIKFKIFLFKLQLNIKHNYLQFSWPTVKNLLILCGFFNSSWAYSNITDRNYNTLKIQHIIISTGAHYQIRDLSINKFSIANSEILSHKFNAGTKTLLLKAKMKGFSEVLTWQTSNIVKKYHVYVLSKKEHADILHMGKNLENMGLSFKFEGRLLRIKGELKTLKDYQLFQKLYKINQEKMISEVILTKKIRNLIIGKVYKLFYQEDIMSISCEAQMDKVYCSYSTGLLPSSSILKHLKNTYNVSFLEINEYKKTTNYLLKIKLIQIENLDGLDFSLGLNQLSANLTDLFSTGINSLVSNNTLFINENNFHVSTLAQPQTYLQMNTPAKIEVGANIPYQGLTSNNVASQTTWKFAGIRIKVSIKSIGQSFLLKYETQFTKPSGTNGQIVGTKESASAIIELNKPLELFQIGYQTNATSVSQIPIIANIPLLGSLFKSRSNKNTFKKISALVSLQEK